MSHEFLQQYAESKATEPTENLYWLGSDTMGQSEEVYCHACAKEKRTGDQFVDGGWSGESDSQRQCDECGKELRCSPTDYAADQELEHWEQHGPPVDGEQWFSLAWAMRAFSTNDARWERVAKLFAKWGIQEGKVS